MILPQAFYMQETTLVAKQLLGCFRPNVTQEINQQQIILSLVAAGYGVSLAPRSTPGVIENKDVVYLDLVEPAPTVEFNIVWRRDDSSPGLHAFLETVRQVSQDGIK